MLRPIVTLDLNNQIINDLHKKGFIYVEDFLNHVNIEEMLCLHKLEIKEQLKYCELLALDVWQTETQQTSISMCCSDLNTVLENNFHYGVITELCGAPFTGKTQICMQLSILVQLNKCHGGLNGRAIYIDTRSGITVLRFRDLLRGCNNYYKDLNLHEDEAFKCIEIFSPSTIEEFLQIINNLKFEIKQVKYNKQVRLIVVDSLSMPILCSIDDPLKRTYYYSLILQQLHELTLNHDLVIVVTNELVVQIDKNGKPYLASAGGQYVANYVFVKLELTKLTDTKFATRIIKSPSLPEISVAFMITEDGIRNIS